MTVAEVRDWLRIDGTANDDIITGLISAAQSYIEATTGMSEGDQGSFQLAVTCGKMLISLWYNPDAEGHEQLQRTIDMLLKAITTVARECATN